MQTALQSFGRRNVFRLFDFSLLQFLKFTILLNLHSDNNQIKAQIVIFKYLYIFITLNSSNILQYFLFYSDFHCVINQYWNKSWISHSVFLKNLLQYVLLPLEFWFSIAHLNVVVVLQFLWSCFMNYVCKYVLFLSHCVFTIRIRFV